MINRHQKGLWQKAKTENVSRKRVSLCQIAPHKQEKINVSSQGLWEMEGCNLRHRKTNLNHVSYVRF